MDSSLVQQRKLLKAILRICLSIEMLSLNSFARRRESANRNRRKKMSKS
jgi:hypothetical protein